MFGVALEGGGARGAYHIGVAKALRDKGYEVDGYVGTSIGAINAAILVQGDLDLAEELWTNITMEQLFDLDEQVLIHLAEMRALKLDLDSPANISKAIAKVIKGKGINTDKIYTFLQKYLDEDKIRNSKKDFGLVTVSINERKPYELMLDDIPNGKLLEYVMASATFPGFRPTTIDKNSFVDGGFYNMCPINLLYERDYDKILAVRTQSFGVYRRVPESDRITIITSHDSLGKLLLFSKETSEANISTGYYDGLRYIDNLAGYSYYIKNIDRDKLGTILMLLKDKDILRIGEFLGIPPIAPKRMLFEKIIPQLHVFLKLKRGMDYAEFVVAVLEYVAEQLNIPRYHIYSFNQLCSKTMDAFKQSSLFNQNPKILPIDIFSKRRHAVNLLFKFLFTDLS